MKRFLLLIFFVLLASRTSFATDAPGPTAGETSAANVSVAAQTFWISFNANGGKGSMKPIQVTSGTVVSLPQNTYKWKDYVFRGWATKKDGALAFKNKQAVVFLSAEDSPATLYALWTKKKYQVKFLANGGKGKMSVLPMKYGKAAKLTKNRFYRYGHLFLGWAQTKETADAGIIDYKDGKKVKNLVTTGKTAKLYAVWKPFTTKASGVVRFALCQTPCGVFSSSTCIDDTFNWVRNSLRGDEDVIVFPELAFVKFSKQSSAWRQGSTVWAKAREFAQERGAWVLVNHPNKSSSKKYSETRVFAPDGRVAAVYRKRCLAEMDVKAKFSSGPAAVMANLPFARLGLLICKDAFVPSKGSAPYAKADVLLVQFAHPGVTKRTKAVRKWFHSPKKARSEILGARRDWKFLRKPFMAVNKSGPDGNYQLAGGAFAAKANGSVVAKAGASPTILFVEFPLQANGKIAPVPSLSPDLPDPPSASSDLPESTDSSTDLSGASSDSPESTDSTTDLPGASSDSPESTDDSTGVPESIS